MTDVELLERFSRGERRALARLLTRVENDDRARAWLWGHILHRSGRALVAGITGSPGAGKSSLVSALIGHWRKAGKTVGVVAVDPSSPFTGGAILGDRVRMVELACDPGVFVRSVASRGSLGGLARSARDMVRLLDAFGFDVILLETVGVGQSEVDVMNVADTTVVVLTPAGGDGVQAIKAGIMEIADVFVVNKADLPQSRQMVMEVESMLDAGKWEGWRPPVLPTVATAGQGIEAVAEAVARHRTYLEESGLRSRRREESLRQELGELVERAVHLWVRQQVGDRLSALASQLARGAVDAGGAGALIGGLLDSLLPGLDGLANASGAMAVRPVNNRDDGAGNAGHALEGGERADAGADRRVAGAPA